MKILMACVRLLYSVPSWELSSSELQKLNTVWNGFLQKMIAGNMRAKMLRRRVIVRRESTPPSLVDGDLDWAFKISNAKMHQLTQSQPIEDFLQHTMA